MSGLVSTQESFCHEWNFFVLSLSVMWEYSFEASLLAEFLLGLAAEEGFPLLVRLDQSKPAAAAQQRCRWSISHS